MDRLKSIKETIEQKKPFHGELMDDIQWLIEQASKFELLQKVVEVCNDKCISPKELANIIQEKRRIK